MVHMRVPMENVVNTDGAYAHKPQENHRSEQEPDSVCTVVLERKQTYQNYTSSRYFYICTSKQKTEKKKVSNTIRITFITRSWPLRVYLDKELITPRSKCLVLDNIVYKQPLDKSREQSKTLIQ